MLKLLVCFSLQYVLLCTRRNHAALRHAYAGRLGSSLIPTLDPMAPEELLEFTTFNCIVETAATEGPAAKRMV